MGKKHKPDIFISSTNTGAVKAVEFSQTNGVNYAVFHTMAGKAAQDLASVFDAAHKNVQILSDTPGDNGEHIIACRMDYPLDEMISALNAQSEGLEREKEQKTGPDPMFLRGCTSIIGQASQLVSSATTLPRNTPLPTTRKEILGNISADIMGFAVLNLMANFCNMKFGSQHKIDHNHTIALKEEFNRHLAQLVDNPDALPDPRSEAISRRPPEKLTFGQKAYNFAQSQSTTIGEVALRMAGTASMIFPANQWREAYAEAAQGNYAQAFAKAINKDPVNRAVGITTMVGKVSSLIAKEENPYSDKEQNAFDVFREKYAFKASSVIEGVAAAGMAVDRVVNRRSIIGADKYYNPNDKNQFDALPRDWAGAFGNGVFVLGYGIRYPAKVGTLDVDLKEVYAHISDGLALLPRDTIPEALAGTVISLKNHFKDKRDLSAADIYAGISNELENHHQIAMPTLQEQLEDARKQGHNQIVHLPANAMSMIVEPPKHNVAHTNYQERVATPELATALA